jgi:hypothetical protein
VTWHSLSVAPEPLAFWKKKLKDLEFLSLKKLKISSEDMYPAAPEHIYGFFLYKKNLVIGSFIIFSSVLPSVGGGWDLLGELLQIGKVLVYNL